MLKKISLSALLLCITCFVFSETGKIEGYISDAENKTPLNGASVIIAGSKGDNSDPFGKFSIGGINPGQYELVISHVSYKTEIIPVEVKEDLVIQKQKLLKKQKERIMCRWPHLLQALVVFLQK